MGFSHAWYSSQSVSHNNRRLRKSWIMNTKITGHPFVFAGYATEPPSVVSPLRPITYPTLFTDQGIKLVLSMPFVAFIKCSKFMFERCVAFNVNQKKIFNSIIRFYSVFMMYLLMYCELSSKLFLHYRSMFKASISIITNKNISILSQRLSTLPIWVILPVKMGNCFRIDRVCSFTATDRTVFSAAFSNLSNFSNKYFSAILATSRQTLFTISGSITTLKIRVTNFAYFCERLDVVHSYSRYCTQDLPICK